jgi:hypothetical protein
MIESYLLGRMSAIERDDLEREMAGNAALRAEVDLQREHTLAVELGAMQRMLRSVGAEQVRHAGKSDKGWSGTMKYAAVVAIVLSGAFWMLMRPAANERLFAKHFVADPGLPVTMGARADLAFADAMVSYKEGKYAEAREKWSALRKDGPTTDTLRYYIASAALAMDDAEGAIPLFGGLAADSASVFRDKARWYLFLAYVKLGAKAEARAVPLDDDPTYGERARAIKAELK